MKLLKSIEHPNKTLIISETGWPSEGYVDTAAVASPENQVTFFKSFYCNVAIGKPSWQYYYFTGIDNSWRLLKKGMESGVEGHFGIFTDKRKMKPQFKGLNFKCPGDSNTVYEMPEPLPVNASSEDYAELKGSTTRNESSATLFRNSSIMTFLTALFLAIIM